MHESDPDLGTIELMKKIKTGALRRRLSLGIAGAKSGAGLLGSSLSGLLVSEDKKEEHKAQALEREAKRFVAELGQLKGAYVKIGQMLALYGEHLLPPAVTKALHTLEAQTTAIEWSQVAINLEEKFDHSKLNIEKEAFAAASLSQVHRASLDKKAVCLKIQYPGIAEAIDADFKHVLQMLKLSRWAKSSRHLEQVTKQLKQHLVEEVDYAMELEKAEKVRQYLDDDKRYLIPQYYENYCDSTVLTMDFIQAADVNDQAVQNLSLERRNRIAVAMLELFFAEAFDWGLIQTDPNFGNYRILIDQKGENDQLVLLDFGAVHYFEPEFQLSLKKTILGTWSGHDQEIIDGLIGLHCLREDDDDEVKQSFIEFCCLLMEPFLEDFSTVPAKALNENGVYNWYKSDLLKRSGKLGAKSMIHKGFTLPPSEFMLIARKLTGVFSFVCAIKAEFNASELLNLYKESS